MYFLRRSLLARVPLSRRHLVSHPGPHSVAKFSSRPGCVLSINSEPNIIAVLYQQDDWSPVGPDALQSTLNYAPPPPKDTSARVVDRQPTSQAQLQQLQ